jgi:predicted flap endonuclease-1-like 5' DNA nuclease
VVNPRACVCCTCAVQLNWARRAQAEREAKDMQWLFFLAGILVGVVGEWLIDLLYWRKKRVAWAEKESSLRAEVVTAQSETETVRAEVLTAQAETAAVRAEVVAAQAQTEAVQADLAASEDRAVKLAMAAEPQDDLTVIEGIGPKIADLLDEHEVRTFAVLAETSVDRLRVVLAEGGPRFRLADPTSWPRQARLAANRDWERLQQVKQQLAGGVRRPPEPKPVPKDDLTIIEGIGEKIAELLNQNGIFTFAQLAAATGDQLRTILRLAGPAYRMADPYTWPHQAQLAADRDWVQLQSVNQRLTGGVRRRTPAATAPEAPAPDESGASEPGSDEVSAAAPGEPAPAGSDFAESPFADSAPDEPGPENG